MKVEDELPRLLRALSLSQRFHLYIAQCENPRAADRLIEAIETELPALRGAPVRVVRFEPYPGRTTDAPLTRELLETVLVPLLDAPPERQQHGTIHVVDASRASSSDDDTWAQFFAAWNEKRNLLQRLEGEVIVVLPAALALVFATDAPDVWSIRSGEYGIAEGGIALSSDVRDHVPTWRLIPLWSLFGGDLIVNDWLDVFVQAKYVPQAKDEDRQHEISQRIRDSEQMIAVGRFAEAIATLDPLVIENASSDERARIVTTRAVALAALDTPGQVWASTVSVLTQEQKVWFYTRDSVLGGMAYTAWCGGELVVAEDIDGSWREWNPSSLNASELLRAMERGLMRKAGEIAAEIAPPMPARDVRGRRGQAAAFIAPRLIAADYKFLFQAIGEARRDAADVIAITSTSAYVRRAAALSVFLAAADGDLAGARRMLAISMPVRPRVESLAMRDDRYLESLNLYVKGIVEMTAGNRVEALDTFELALEAIAQWSQIGLERRSIRRAHVATLLAAAVVDPDHARAEARAIEARDLADALLHPTGEDFIARVLAVEARWISASYAEEAETAHARAREAIELAQPLRAAGVGSWNALVNRRFNDRTVGPPL